MSFGLDGEKILASVDVSSESLVAIHKTFQKTSIDFGRVVDLLERLEKPLKNSLLAIGISALIFSSASLIGRLSQAWKIANSKKSSTSSEGQ